MIAAPSQALFWSRTTRNAPEGDAMKRLQHEPHFQVKATNVHERKGSTGKVTLPIQQHTTKTNNLVQYRSMDATDPAKTAEFAEDSSLRGQPAPTNLHKFICYPSVLSPII
eukprot:4018439-Amphidinium_carterae.1